MKRSILLVMALVSSAAFAQEAPNLSKVFKARVRASDGSFSSAYLVIKEEDSLPPDNGGLFVKRVAGTYYVPGEFQTPITITMMCRRMFVQSCDVMGRFEKRTAQEFAVYFIRGSILISGNNLFSSHHGNNLNLFKQDGSLGTHVGSFFLDPVVAIHQGFVKERSLAGQFLAVNDATGTVEGLLSVGSEEPFHEHVKIAFMGETVSLSNFTAQEDSCRFVSHMALEECELIGNGKGSAIEKIHLRLPFERMDGIPRVSKRPGILEVELHSFAAQPSNYSLIAIH